MIVQHRPHIRAALPALSLLAALLLSAGVATHAQTVAPPAAVAPLSDAATRTWLAQQFAANDAGRLQQPAGAPSELARSLATWDWLRRTPPKGQEPLLGVQADFILAHDGWPGSVSLRRRAEQQALQPTTADSDALGFFRRVAPQTAGGQAKMALLLSGPEAEKLARAAWVRPGIPVEIEAPFVARFGSLFTADETAKRVDRLIWAGQTTAATRALPLLDAGGRQLMEARLAYRNNLADADALAAALPARLRRDIGLAYDRAIWLERRGRLAEAEQQLASGNFDAGAGDPDALLDKRLAMGRAAMRRGDHETAYRLLAGHKAFAAGVDLGALPLSQRVKLSDTEWLAGWLALRKLNRPQDAINNFNTFRQVVNTPISLSRGEYWLGRAEKARGNTAAAQAAFERGAQYFDYFYGQLSAEELGRAPRLPPKPAPADIAAATRTQFEKSSLLRATRLLNEMDSRERELLFVRALADSVATPGEAQLAAEWSRRLDRPDLGVWTWKNARPRGDLSTFDTAYPQLPASAPVPAPEWIMSHAIARQESSFDRTAVSSAGARGLMQLMPATASDVSKKLGLPFSLAKLTEDPAYNLTLGSWYIGQRRDGFGNAAMAIAAYNAGAGNVSKWVPMNGDPRAGADVIDWVEMIPFQETRNYVHRVIENAVVYSLLDPKRQDSAPKPSRWLKER